MVGMITNSTKDATDTPTAIATVSTPVLSGLQLEESGWTMSGVLVLNQG